MSDVYIHLCCETPASENVSEENSATKSMDRPQSGVSNVSHSPEEKHKRKTKEKPQLSKLEELLIKLYQAILNVNFDVV